jgi:hypothetical protein
MSEIDNDIGFKEKRTIFAENGRKLPKIRWKFAENSLKIRRKFAEKLSKKLS